MSRGRYAIDSLFYSQNAPYIYDLFKRFKNGEDIPAEWLSFFNALPPGSDLDDLPQLPSREGPVAGNSIATEAGFSRDNVRNTARALMLIRAYRVRGHLAANLDPLGLNPPQDHPELDPASYGFTPADYNTPIFLDGVLGFEQATIHQILERLKATYSHSIGTEFMHIMHPAQKAWIQERLENTKPTFNPEEKLSIYREIARAELFEKFLHVKFPGAKRFGVDGGEALLPLMETLLHRSVTHGVNEIVVGMAHRGRLCLLANHFGQRKRFIFAQFMGSTMFRQSSFSGSGDVKYHLGFSNDRDVNGSQVHLSLCHNPSHLEAVNPVALGKVRAKQNRKQDFDRKQVMGVLLHGDAAFAGQGMVAETLELSGLRGYLTGGTIHIIINNQIGFTTSPPHSRTSPYSSEVAKIVQAPIFHVNGDDPEALCHAMQIATDFNRTFGQDVVVDMFCYRRYGHNEGDEPSFTQPLMYKRISNHPSVLNLYGETLVSEGIPRETLDKIQQEVSTHLNEEFEAARKVAEDESEKAEPDWLKGVWSKINPNEDNPSSLNQAVTGVSADDLKSYIASLIKLPEAFNLHPKLQRLWQQKEQMMNSGQNIDWGTGEALAFASLLAEGYGVRLSGQDCGRGTFSHRHAVVTDQMTEEKYRPLNSLGADQAYFDVVDSPLAEASVLGFEYGYSSADPNTLVMWEAQFGDFANGAQVIVDQFITSAEAKWLRLSGLVMLLPHGWEGQGPEHSSARLERYLQLCAEHNIRVMNCSTPASYFHALRRQIISPHRKPLIIMTPKSLLRHKLAVSSLDEMGPLTNFKPVLDDLSVDKKAVTRVVLCSGKVYYDLLQARDEQNLGHVALVRLEQLYPFPKVELREILSAYPGARVVWCQEEPQNMGAWFFLDRRLEKVLSALGSNQTSIPFAGRLSAASPATGLASTHQQEQNNLVRQALTEV
jgi:2-oxoglutarate dehydrogenase E1 component